MPATALDTETHSRIADEDERLVTRLVTHRFVALGELMRAYDTFQDAATARALDVSIANR